MNGQGPTVNRLQSTVYCPGRARYIHEEASRVNDSVEVKYLGHSTFLFRSPGGKRILMEAWVGGNPACPESDKQLPPIDIMLITHGHPDHVSDAVEIAKQHKPQIACAYELGAWLESKGVGNITQMNKGGTVIFDGIRATMVDAKHSSGFVEEDGTIVYLGSASGFVVQFENNFRLYYAGDTCVFGDMALIREIYHPQVAFLPIGDLFTMGPQEAAHAARLVQTPIIVPMHYGTFPLLTGTPDELIRLLPAGVELLELSPGESCRLGG